MTALPVRTEEMRIERGFTRVRAYLGGVAVFDTTRPLLVWEKPYYPQFYIPREDVLAELFPTGDVKTDVLGAAVTYDVVTENAKAESAAWVYHPDEAPQGASLADHVRFDWEALHSWFQEDEQIYTHPRDPYTRVDILPSSRHVRVELDGEVIAETRRPLVLAETGLPLRYYIPKVDVRMDLLQHTDSRTHCPYKGTAEYWTIAVERQGDTVSLRDGTSASRTEGSPRDGSLKDAVWSYRTPLPESQRIAGHVCFWPERSPRLSVLVDGERVGA